MGYELHIVRNREWWNDDANGGITLDEWSAFVGNDSSMRMDGFAEVTSPDGSKLRMTNSGLTVWTEYAGNEDGGNQSWFDFRDGRIVVKNPDQDILAKMLSIADTLDAIVVGDDDEQYTSPTDHGMPRRESSLAPSKPWWRFW